MPPPRPRTTRRDTIYDGRVFRIERDLVVMPGGRVVPMEAVRHRGSVVLLPQPAPDRVFLVRQFRHVIGRWIWELPAGTLEPGEAPSRAARRECVEEVGWRPARVTRLGTFYPSPGFCDERMVFYLCADLRRPAKPLAGDPDELIEARTFSLRQAWRLARRGAIQDMKTVVGLMLLDRRIGFR